MEKQAFKRIPVESSNIAFIGHSYPRRMLEVGFNNGSVYRYKGVNNKTYHELLDAHSKGRAFNELIRGKYPYKQTVDKNGEKITGGYKKMAMRNFDEFTKTAGILRTYTDALTGRNVERAKRRYGRTMDNLDKAIQIGERLEQNRAGAEGVFNKAKAARMENGKAIKESLNKTRGLRGKFNQIVDNMNKRSPIYDDKMTEGKNMLKDRLLPLRKRALGLASAAGAANDMAFDTAKQMPAAAVNMAQRGGERLKRSKLLRDRKKLDSTFDNAKGAFQAATNKANKAADLINKKHSDVLNAQRGVRKAQIGSVAAKGATAAGVIGTAMLGRKLYKNWKNSKQQPDEQQYSQAPQYSQTPQYGMVQNGMM